MLVQNIAENVGLASVALGRRVAPLVRSAGRASDPDELLFAVDDPPLHSCRGNDGQGRLARPANTYQYNGGVGAERGDFARSMCRKRNGRMLP